MADFFTAGATGDDTYIFSGQFGHYFINDFSPGQDKLVFPGLNASDVTVSRGGTNLEVTVKGTGDYVAMITDHDVQLVFGGNVTM